MSLVKRKKQVTFARRVSCVSISIVIYTYIQRDYELMQHSLMLFFVFVSAISSPVSWSTFDNDNAMSFDECELYAIIDNPRANTLWKMNVFFTFFSRFRAMWPPIFPKPITPTFELHTDVELNIWFPKYPHASRCASSWRFSTEFENNFCAIFPDFCFLNKVDQRICFNNFLHWSI